MKHRIFLCLLIVLLLLTAPVFAQDDESPPEPTPIEDVAPTEAIVVDAPSPAPVAADEGGGSDFTQQAYLTIIVVQFLVIALLAWRIAGYVPPELITLMFDTAANVARLTPNTTDDERIAELRDLITRHFPAQAAQRASPAVSVFSESSKAPETVG